MSLIAILSLATLLVGMIGCSASPGSPHPQRLGGPGAPDPVAKRLVGPGPAVMTMEEAREILPFPIETPGP